MSLIRRTAIAVAAAATLMLPATTAHAADTVAGHAAQHHADQPASKNCWEWL